MLLFFSKLDGLFSDISQGHYVWCCRSYKRSYKQKPPQIIRLYHISSYYINILYISIIQHEIHMFWRRLVAIRLAFAVTKLFHAGSQNCYILRQREEVSVILFITPHRLLRLFIVTLSGNDPVFTDAEPSMGAEWKMAECRKRALSSSGPTGSSVLSRAYLRRYLSFKLRSWFVD